MFDVVALGELLIDFTSNGFSNQGNMLFEANPGGAPCNVLSMLQNLGKKTAFIGKVGNDIFGSMLTDAVKNQGINTDQLRMDDEVPTTLAFVHTKPDGDRSFSFYRNPGADMMLRKDEVDLSVLKQTKIFHFGTLSMTDQNIEETTKYVLEKVKETEALVSFDPNYRPLLWKDPEKAKASMWYGISQCDILKISDDEIEFLTGEKDIDTGIKAILKKYQPKLVCATLGKDGSIMFYHGERVFCDPFCQEKTIETTGAGDTFMACILNGVLENDINSLNISKIQEILTFANAAASIITTRKGALRVMPSKEEVLDLIQVRKS